uniref:T9SS type A sorting domain-containing protein n=1 Tax=candidate division WOR-3 bacterium TaxID=2052148 RepID=A0A7V0Z4J2_UNCW3
MKKIYFIISVIICLASGGILKDDRVLGVDIEVSDGKVRFVTPGAKSSDVLPPTIRYESYRGETLWVDRNHQYAIAEHVSLSGDGMFIQAGWWLNNKRTSLYRTLGNNSPLWTYQLPLTEWYVPVDVSLTGDDIAVGSTGEPFYSFTASSNAPNWRFNLPQGFKIATSSQGTSVAVSDDGSIYGVLARATDIGKLFILNQDGDTIRTITFSPNNGIYGLDISNDGSVFCISTYYATYIYNLDGTRRDSLYNYGQGSAKISGDGKYVVKGHFNGRVYLYRWNGSNYTLKWEHYTGHPWVTAVAISDNGATIMAGTFQYSPTFSGKVLMYDSTSSTPLWEYTQYGDYVDDCALSANGERGAAVSWGRYQGTFGDVLTVFNKSSSTPIFQLLDDIDEPGSLTSVDISNDGSFVTAGGKAVHAREFGNGGEVYAIRIIDQLTNDVGVKSIDSPGYFLQVGQSITPQATVKNYGTATASFNTYCFIYDSLGSVLYQSTALVSNLQSGAEQVLNFSPNWTVPAYGRYMTIVYTGLPTDQYPANDTLKKGSICFHDGAVSKIDFPFNELTLNYSKPPRVTIANNGSYSENIPVICKIYDAGNNLVYTGTGQTYLTPLQSSTIWLSPAWTPSATQIHSVYFYTNVNEDYNHNNDTLMKQVNITTEILYDDGNLDVYGYVSPNFYDNKFAQKMIPCLPAPFVITQARFYASTSSPMLISLHADSSGLPGLNPDYYIAPPETILPSGTGWAVKNYSPAIIINNSNPFWLVLHWLSSSPSAPYVGMDNAIPRDSASYWYWTESSNYGWHAWYPYDFMMRVYTDYAPGISDNQKTTEEKFMLYHPNPNPFNNKIRIAFNIPEEKEIKLNIYDATGRLVKSLLNGTMAKGRHLILWNGTDNENRELSSGIYFVKVDYENKTFTEKIILVK